MKLTSINLTHAFEITDVPALDPIRVYLQVHGNGGGRLTIECDVDAWVTYWGPWEGRNLLQFIAEADVRYLRSSLGGDPEDSDYLGRIVTAVKEAVRKLGEEGA